MPAYGFGFGFGWIFFPILFLFLLFGLAFAFSRSRRRGWGRGGYGYAGYGGWGGRGWDPNGVAPDDLPPPIRSTLERWHAGAHQPARRDAGPGHGVLRPSPPGLRRRAPEPFGRSTGPDATVRRVRASACRSLG